MSFALQRILSELVLPPFGPFLLLLLATFVCLRYRRSGLALAAVAVLLQAGASLSGLNTYLNAPWPEVPERVAPPYPEAEAIVVLGGGRYFNAPEWGGDTAGPSTLERVRYAAKLHRETGKPILVSGGKPGGTGTRSEADIMRGILEEEFGVPVRWVEEESEDTGQNGRNAARLLVADGIERIYLVTHGAHMPRALSAFDGTGITPLPMITGFIRPEPHSVYGWTPSWYGLAINRYWFYERLARLKP